MIAIRGIWRISPYVVSNPGYIEVGRARQETTIEWNDPVSVLFTVLGKKDDREKVCWHFVGVDKPKSIHLYPSYRFATHV